MTQVCNLECRSQQANNVVLHCRGCSGALVIPSPLCGLPSSATESMLCLMLFSSCISAGVSLGLHGPPSLARSAVLLIICLYHSGLTTAHNVPSLCSARTAGCWYPVFCAKQASNQCCLACSEMISPIRLHSMFAAPGCSSYRVVCCAWQTLQPIIPRQAGIAECCQVSGSYRYSFATIGNYPLPGPTYWYW